MINYQKTERLPHGKHPRDMNGEELWEAYGKWAIKCARLFWVRHMSLISCAEELLGPAFEGLVIAAKSWDPEGKASFCTYSHKNLTWEFLDYLDRVFMGKHYQEKGAKQEPYVISRDTTETASEEHDKWTGRIFNAEQQMLSSCSIEYATQADRLLDLMRVVRQVIVATDGIFNREVGDHILACIMDEAQAMSVETLPKTTTRQNVSLNLQRVRKKIREQLNAA